jgi:DNA topoisomerase IB
LSSYQYHNSCYRNKEENKENCRIWFQQYLQAYQELQDLREQSQKQLIHQIEHLSI